LHTVGLSTIESAQRIVPQQGDLRTPDPPSYYALLQDNDQALDCVEKAVRNGFGHKEWIESDPDFLSVRNHPRFQALLQGLSRTSSKSALGNPEVMVRSGF